MIQKKWRLRLPELGFEELNYSLNGFHQPGHN